MCGSTITQNYMIIVLHVEQVFPRQMTSLIQPTLLTWNTTHYSSASLVPRPPPFLIFGLRFAVSSASVYYTERKLKNKKRGRPGNEVK